MMTRGFLTFILAMLAGLGVPQYSSAHEESCVNAKDLPNFKRVNEKLYRGGQPTREGFLCLEKLGIKTVINVRTNNMSAKFTEDLPFNYEKRTMDALAPSDENLLWFIERATRPDGAPAFLHCRAGSHRTGWLVAMYRVLVDGWDKERAIAEMRAKDTGFDDEYPNLIEFVRKADLTNLSSRIERH